MNDDNISAAAKSAVRLAHQGRAFVGHMPPRQAAYLYEHGLRVMLRSNRTVASFKQASLGGDFIVVPKESLPGPVWASIEAQGWAPMIVPPRSEGWLRARGLAALAGIEELAEGGRFVILSARDHVVLRGRVPGGISVGDVVDRSCRAAARFIAEWRFDLHPVYEVARDDAESGFMWLRPFGHPHTHVS